MTVERKKHTVDAQGRSYGRVAGEVAKLLRGKQKISFRPHIDVGDHVEVINLSKIVFTGTKLQTTFKHRHSGYPGGLKSANLETLFSKDPIKMFHQTVYGMLPKNKLTKSWLKRLTIKKD